jgi:hypothetical protein
MIYLLRRKIILPLVIFILMKNSLAKVVISAFYTPAKNLRKAFSASLQGPSVA